MANDAVDLPGDQNTASQRHWLYGFNAFVLVVVGLVVLAFILVVCNLPQVRDHTRWDWSSNRANSLSGSSQKMLAEIDQKKQEYSLISLFTDPSDEEKRDNPTVAAAQSLHRQQINDLLRQYAKNSTYIKVEDQGDAAREELETRLREKYKTELEPYAAAVKDFDPLMKKLSDFLKEQAAAIGAVGQKPGTPQEEMQAAAMIQAEFSSAPASFDQVQRLIHRETDSKLPRWSVLTTTISQNLDDLAPLFELLSDPAKMKAAGLPPTLVSYFSSSQEKYKGMSDAIKAYKDKLSKLEPLKVEEVVNGLDKNTVVILGDKSAKVVSAFDIYSAAPAGGGSSGETFNGEQAISSALFAMAKPDKVKVVFVTASPQHLLTDSFTDMQDILQQNNYEVVEWSPPAPPQPGSPPQPDVAPPAEGKGVVWIVFPPDAPNMQMMMMGAGMPNPQALVDATRKHMAEGGQVLFLAEASNAMMGPGGFPFDDLVKDFGIDVQSKYTVLHLMEGDDPDTGQHVKQTIPYIEVGSKDSRFVDHEITTPIQSLPTVFGPVQTQQGMNGSATVINVKSPLPTGVEALVLVKTPYSSDYWGAANPSGTATYDKESDFAAPVPMMAIATKNKGQKDNDGKSSEQRIAVIGSKMIGSNFFLDLSVSRVSGGTVYRLPRFPGNSELMKNTILWLSGYENMIAVSAKSSPAARIGDVKPGALLAIRFGVLLIVPLVALIIGSIVWVGRRR